MEGFNDRTNTLVNTELFIAVQNYTGKKFKYMREIKILTIKPRNKFKLNGYIRKSNSVRFIFAFSFNGCQPM